MTTHVRKRFGSVPYEYDDVTRLATVSEPMDGKTYEDAKSLADEFGVSLVPPNPAGYVEGQPVFVGSPNAIESLIDGVQHNLDTTGFQDVEVVWYGRAESLPIHPVKYDELEVIGLAEDAPGQWVTLAEFVDGDDANALHERFSEGGLGQKHIGQETYARIYPVLKTGDDLRYGVEILISGM